MCGIGAILRTEKAQREPERVARWAREIILGNRVRGTDAAGIAALRVDTAEVLISKMPVDPLVFAKFISATNEWADADLVITHDRAYTSCQPLNNYCNHPLYVKLVDGSLLVLVHNGVIHNSFSSIVNDTVASVDSMHLLLAFKRYYNHSRRATEAMIDAIESLDGSMAILAFHVKPNGDAKFFVYRNYNPLVYAEENGYLIYASISKAMPTIDLMSRAKPVEAYNLYVYDVPSSTGKPLEVIEGVGVVLSKTTNYWKEYYKYYYGYE